MNYLVARESGEAVYSQIYRALSQEIREHISLFTSQCECRKWTTCGVCYHTVSRGPHTDQHSIRLTKQKNL